MTLYDDTPTISSDDDYKSTSNPENVQRVANIFDAYAYSYLFPDANEAYSYEVVLTALSQYPKFCNETFNDLSLDDICRLELSTLFTFAASMSNKQDTSSGTPIYQQGLYLMDNAACDGNNDTSCEFYNITNGNATWAFAFEEGDT